jgi:cytoskeletal protein RodZ
MESFGEHLKSLRQERGVSLEQIADNTKIALTNLELLERDRFDLLPPKVFIKGFIRSYVKELGLNPEDAVRMFDDFTHEGEIPDYFEEEHPVFRQEEETTSFFRSPLFTVLLTAAGVLSFIILIVTGVARLVYYNGGPDDNGPTVVTARPPEGPDAQFPESTAPPVTETMPGTFTEPPPRQGGKKILEVLAVAPAWIRVEPDTGSPEERVLTPGQKEIFTGKEQFFVQTGNAGALRLRYDGQELPIPGGMDESRAFTIP